MRRFWAFFLMALLAVNSFPLAAQVRLVCRMTGEAMKPIAVEDDPRSCCAIRGGSSGGVELANRSCCDLKTTPGHAPLPSAISPEPAGYTAALPMVSIAVPIPLLYELPPSVAYQDVLRYRGPPLSSASPRGPPVFS